jgi:myosin heavy subunit
VDALKADSVGHDSMVNLHASDLLISGFQANLSQPMIKSLLSSESTKQAIASLFARFPVAPAQLQCQGAQVCYCACSALQNRILLNLFEIYFAAALSHSGDNTDIVIMKSFVERTAKSLNNSGCSFTHTEHNSYRSSLYLRNREEFTSKRPPTRDWRTAITELHIQNAETSHNALMKKVDDICFDLERRCYDIEGPVRSAEEERDRHKHDAEQLRQQNEDLARQLNQSTQAVSTLQQDLARLEEHAGLASARAEELSEALELARQELCGQQHRSDDALRAEQERGRSRELELIATSTEKDDQLEELQESVRQLESQIQRLQQVVETSSHERATSAETTEVLGQEISEVRNLLEAKTLLCCQKEDEVKRLLAENTDLQTELGSAQTIVGHPSPSPPLIQPSLLSSLCQYHMLFPRNYSPILQIDDQAQEIEQLHSTLQLVEEKRKADMLNFGHEKEAEIAKLASEVCICRRCLVEKSQHLLTTNCSLPHKRRQTGSCRKPCKRLQTMLPRSFSSRINAFICWRKR